MTARQAALLLPALVRAAPWPAVALAMAAAVGAVGLVSALAGERYAPLALQAAAPALAGAAAALLAEPRAALDALPINLARRRTLLLAAALPLLALLWWGLLTIAGLAGSSQARPLTLQLAAVVALTLGLAACGDIALAVAGVGLAFGAARGMLEPQLFPAGPDAAHWAGAQLCWAGTTLAGLTLLAAATRRSA